jgi:hypothetical protein
MRAIPPLLRGDSYAGAAIGDAAPDLMALSEWLIRRSAAGRSARAMAQFVWSLAERCAASDPANEVRTLAIARPAMAADAADLVEAVAAGDGATIEAAAARISASEGDAEAEMLGFLDRTVHRARSVSRRYADWPAALDSLDSFRALPRLTRAELDADIGQVCARGEPVDYFTATSATTTGQALLTPHSMAELQHLGAYANGLARPFGAAAPEGDTSPLGGMTLRLMPAGRLIGSPSADGRTVVAAYETNAARENIFDLWDYIIGQVFVEFPTADGPKPIDTIHATPGFGLILLTRYMLQRGIDPASSAVRHLIVSGSWVGRHTRRWLEQAWNAAIHNTYSCSELTGAAVETPGRAGCYRFGAHVHAEIVDPDTGRHVAPGGEGRIVLSGTYPFHRAAVLLRYENGDWGRWSGAGVDGFPEFQMLGRTRDILRFRDRQGRAITLASVPIREALDGFGFVPKIPRPQFLLHVEEGRVPRVTIDVECYAVAGAAWRAKAQEDIRAAVLEEMPELAAACEAGDAELTIGLHFRSKLTNRSSVI